MLLYKNVSFFLCPTCIYILLLYYDFIVSIAYRLLLLYTISSLLIFFSPARIYSMLLYKNVSFFLCQTCIYILLLLYYDFLVSIAYRVLVLYTISSLMIFFSPAKIYVMLLHYNCKQLLWMKHFLLVQLWISKWV
jgi:hypothetical protein